MRQILIPLLRHRMMPLLVVFQVALACAIACNALFLLQQKLVPILSSDGIGHPDRLLVVWRIVSRGDPWQTSRLQETEAALRAVPGVSSVSVAGSLPMVTNARFNGDVTAVDSGFKANTSIYVGDHLVRTLDLKLVSGRDFTEDEQSVQNKGTGFGQSGPTIITRALARKLFPNGKALGREISIGRIDNPARRTVVGVVDHLMRNDFGTGTSRDLDNTMLFPGIPGKWPIPSIGVRMTAQANSALVLKQVKNVVVRMLGSRTVQGIDPVYNSYAQLRDRALARSRAAVWLLAGVTLVVLIVTLAGIMGMTAYWVQQRTRQVGIRRALGARRRDILHYLQLENLMVVGVGVVLGLLAAYLVNVWLMHHYELSRLPWSYLPLGAAILLTLGQLSVLGPALRAANVPPVVATRSV